MDTKVDYIPALEDLKDYSIYKEYPAIFKPVDKFPIDKIQLNKKRDFAVSEMDVNFIVNEFSLDAWEPIMINKRYFLMDGQPNVGWRLQRRWD